MLDDNTSLTFMSYASHDGVIFFICFFLIFATTVTKNSTKQLDKKIFEIKENLRVLQDKYFDIDEKIVAFTIDDGFCGADNPDGDMTNEVRELFKVPKTGIIAGCSILKGKVIRNSKLRVRRESEIIYEGKLTSLKRFKDDVNEVLEGFECGIGIEGFTTFDNKDLIEVYELKEIKRKLQ